MVRTSRAPIEITDEDLFWDAEGALTPDPWASDAMIEADPEPAPEPVAAPPVAR